jgi:thiamine kinase-like enzyme
MPGIEARIHAIPVWDGSVTWQPLKGGLSNESFIVTDTSGKYIARFGRDFPFHHVFRDREIMAARAAHAADFAPEVVYAEPGVMVSRFIEAKTYAAEDVLADIARIAEMARRFHTIMPRQVSGPGFMFWAFHVIRDYARTLEDGGSRMTHRLPEFLSLADELEAVQAPLPIVFGHHDFLPANFLDDGSRLWIIDFEYAGFSTPMFDLAGIASNAEFDNEQSEELLRVYFGKPPDEAVRKSHAAMQCASLLREAMWSMVSELYLDAPGVDYVAYTSENLDRLAAALDRYRSGYGKA